MSRTARRHQVSVSLFPFLAVLICIMGALVILLVLMVARVGAGVQAVASGAIHPDVERRLREQLEDAQWRQTLLLKSRSEKTQELAEKRAGLAHLEDHIRRLEGQAKELLDKVRRIDEGNQLREQDLTVARGEAARLKTEIERKKSALEAARKVASKGEKWYALIPYDGPNGTRRRPIYIECTELGVVVHPEEMVFRAEDFSGPLGPGNPLDAALRTIREHWQRAGGKAGEPYPLLVVRPGGVQAYAAAREALKSWDDEFGYELIGEDKQLDFGEPDAALAATLKQSVAAARQRQVVMAAMMPRRFHSDPITSDSPPEAGQVFGAAGSSASGRGVGTGGGGSGAGLAGGRGDGISDPLGRGSSAPGTPAGAGGNPGTPSTAPPSPVGGQFAQGTGGSAPDSSGGNPTGGQAAGGGYRGGQPSGQPTGQFTFGHPQSAKAGTASAAGGQPGGSSPSRGSGAGGSGTASKSGRGNNWGLPGSRGRVTAVTRTIHLAVLRDRIVLVPEHDDNRPPQHLPISPELSPADVDRFVAAVQREIQGWGLAVADGYWKPLLAMEVAPDAEQLSQQLTAALQGSGFDLERKVR